MKTFVVINPQSANRQTGRRWAQTRAELRRTLGNFGEEFTTEPMHATEIAAHAIKEGYDRIVAAGGDGTLNEVVNGFFEGGKPINPGAVLGVIPLGTGGDFRRTFGWGLDLKSSLARLEGSGTVPMDLGLLEYTAHSGEQASRLFANVCSFGVSGLVDREVNQTSKMFGGRLCFLLGTAKALLKYKDQSVELAIDDQPAQEIRITTVAVANGRYFGGGMCVAPQAVPSDGFFDVTLWSGYAFADFILKAKALYDGSHVKLSGTRCLKCRRLTAASKQEVLLDVDGEQPGRLPCRLSILPGAIRLQVGGDRTPMS
jgi:YegS/Rv2252/BmrU family lipid kinase